MAGGCSGRGGIVLRGSPSDRRTWAKCSCSGSTVPLTGVPGGPVPGPAGFSSWRSRRLERNPRQTAVVDEVGAYQREQWYYWSFHCFRHFQRMVKVNLQVTLIQLPFPTTLNVYANTQGLVAHWKPRLALMEFQRSLNIMRADFTSSLHPL